MVRRAPGCWLRLRDDLFLLSGPARCYRKLLLSYRGIPKLAIVRVATAVLGFASDVGRLGLEGIGDRGRAGEEGPD